MTYPRRALVVTLLAVLCIVGCGPGIADFSKDIGGGYSFVSAGPLQKYILRGDELAVRNLVADFDHDGEVIVALRLVVEVYECDPGPTLTEVVTDHAEYWIIEKSKGTAVGPMDFDEFQARRRELGVREDLRLDRSKLDEMLEIASQYKRREMIEADRCRRFTPR